MVKHELKQLTEARDVGSTFMLSDLLDAVKDIYREHGDIPVYFRYDTMGMMSPILTAASVEFLEGEKGIYCVLSEATADRVMTNAGIELKPQRKEGEDGTAT